MTKVIHIVGTRPNYIKLFPVYSTFKNHFQNIIVDTNQHYDDNMSQIFFKEFGLPFPTYNLNIGSGTHGHQTGELIKQIESILFKEKPNCVIIYGDVNSSLAGALAAVKLHIPIVHIEAGGRSFDKKMPEEINRILIDSISDLLFCIEEKHLLQLKKENISNGYLVGNVMTDATHLLKTKLYPILKDNYYLCTLHRPFNVDDKVKLNKILNKLNSFPHKIIFLTHPRVKNKINKIYPNIEFIDPVNYTDILSYIKHSKGVISDSGGIQCETAILKIPLLTLRPSTEHQETLKLNNKLVSIDTLSPKEFFINQYELPNIWDGTSSKQILKILKQYLNKWTV